MPLLRLGTGARAAGGASKRLLESCRHSTCRQAAREASAGCSAQATGSGGRRAGSGGGQCWGPAGRRRCAACLPIEVMHAGARRPAAWGRWAARQPLHGRAHAPGGGIGCCRGSAASRDRLAVAWRRWRRSGGGADEWRRAEWGESAGSQTGCGPPGKRASGQGASLSCQAEFAPPRWRSQMVGRQTPHPGYWAGRQLLTSCWRASVAPAARSRLPTACFRAPAAHPLH